jgi:hypothetical protein
VATHEKRDHDLVNNFFLAYDDPMDLGHDLFVNLLKSSDAVLQIAGV